MKGRTCPLHCQDSPALLRVQLIQTGLLCRGGTLQREGFQLIEKVTVRWSELPHGGASHLRNWELPPGSGKLCSRQRARVEIFNFCVCQPGCVHSPNSQLSEALGSPSHILAHRVSDRGPAQFPNGCCQKTASGASSGLAWVGAPSAQPLLQTRYRMVSCSPGRGGSGPEDAQVQVSWLHF